MIRNLRVVSLAAVVLGAVSAQAASVAGAHEFEFDGEKTIITGNNASVWQEFTLGSAGVVKCSSATFEATVSGAEVDTITVKPTYPEFACQFGGQYAFVFFNDCAYVFDSDTESGNTTGGSHADAAIECAEGSKIQIHTSLCTITIGPQEIPNAVRYSKDFSTSFFVHWTGHGITVGKEKSTASQNGCLLFPTGAVGKYVGTSTYECFTDEGSPQFNPTTPSGTFEGATTECGVSEF